MMHYPFTCRENVCGVSVDPEVVGPTVPVNVEAEPVPCKKTEHSFDKVFLAQVVNA